jgi:hypothetical protein
MAVFSDRGLGPQRGDDQLGDLGRRVLLLTRDQAPVANGEALEQPGLDVVRTALEELVLDAVRHHLLPGRLVRVVLHTVRGMGYILREQ